MSILFIILSWGLAWEVAFRLGLRHRSAASIFGQYIFIRSNSIALSALMTIGALSIHITFEMLAVGFDLKPMPAAATLAVRFSVMGVVFALMSYVMLSDFLKRVFLPKIQERMGHFDD